MYTKEDRDFALKVLITTIESKDKLVDESKEVPDFLWELIDQCYNRFRYISQRTVIHCVLPGGDK